MILDPFTMRTILTVGFSCFMTEWLCSFSMEYEYIWKRKWSVLTVAYIGCRYIVFVNVILMMALYYSSWGADYCSPAWVVAPCLSMAGLVCAEVVCILRVWSIHKRRLPILFTLLFLLVAMTTVQIISIVYYSNRGLTSDGTCATLSKTLWLSSFWIAPAILDTIIVIFSIAAVVRETRQYGSNRLLTIILRDQVVYFVLVAVACLTTAIIMTYSLSAFDSLNNPPAIVVSSIASTRIVLSLKAEGAAASGSMGGGGSAGRVGQHKHFKYNTGSSSEETGANSSTLNSSTQGVIIKTGPHEKSWFHIRPKTLSHGGRPGETVSASTSSSSSEQPEEQLPSMESMENAAALTAQHHPHSHNGMHVYDIDCESVTTPGTPSRKLKDIKDRTAAAGSRGHTANSNSLASQFDFHPSEAGSSYSPPRGGRHSPFAAVVTAQGAGAQLTEVLTTGGSGRNSPPPFADARGAGSRIIGQQQQQQSHGDCPGGGVIMFTDQVTTVEDAEDLLARQSHDTVTASRRR